MPIMAEELTLPTNSVYTAFPLKRILISDIAGIISGFAVYWLTRNIVAGAVVFGVVCAFGTLLALMSMKRYLTRQDGVTFKPMFGKPVELKWAHFRGVTVHPGAYEVAYVDARATLSFADPTEQARSESFFIPRSMPRSRELLARIDRGLKTLPRSPLSKQQARDMDLELSGMR